VNTPLIEMLRNSEADYYKVVRVSPKNPAQGISFIEHLEKYVLAYDIGYVTIPLPGTVGIFSFDSLHEACAFFALHRDIETTSRNHFLFKGKGRLSDNQAPNISYVRDYKKMKSVDYLESPLLSPDYGGNPRNRFLSAFLPTERISL
jgi:hypothetical protein